MLGEGPGNDGRHLLVGQQHILLHQEVGCRLHVGAGRHWVAPSVQGKEEACVVEAQGTRLEARLTQARGNAVQGQAVVLDLCVGGMVHNNRAQHSTFKW
jgi:hypothetical protein